MLRLWLAFRSERPDFAELALLAPEGWRRNVRENHPLLCGLGVASLWLLCWSAVHTVTRGHGHLPTKGHHRWAEVGGAHAITSSQWACQHEQSKGAG